MKCEFTRRSSAVAMASMILLITACQAETDTVPQTDDDKLYYFMGSNYGKNLEPLGLTDEQIAMVLAGVAQGARGQAMELDEQIYQPKAQQLAMDLRAKNAEQEKQLSREHLERMAAEAGAETTATGIVYRELETGTGESPTIGSTIKAHYHGMLRDGTVFDSSVQRGDPIQIPLGNVVPCWQEAIPKMKPGGKAKITCPSDTAYGDRGSGRIPPGAAITFEVELIEIIE